MASKPRGGSPEELLGKLFGNNSVGQMALYSLVQSMVSEALAPFLETVRQLAASKFPVTPLSPAELADGVNRGFIGEPEAADQARLSGIDGDRFNQMVRQAGEPPGADVLARALRFGLIPEDSGDPNKPGFKQGIEQSRIRNIWTATVKDVARAFPTPNDILDALLQGQIDLERARAEYARLGGVDEYFQLLYDTRGSSPTPLQAIEMVHRGAIPKAGTGPDVVSYDQAFLEGPWRNKWSDVFWKLGDYLPPPRTITAMVGEGSLTDAQGLDYLQRQGLSADLAAAYIAGAHHTKTTKERELTVGIVEELYQAKAISVEQATAMLTALNYSKEDAAFILTLKDIQQMLSTVNSALSKYRTLYIAHKITHNDTVTALDTLGIPSTQRDQLLAVWDGEREAVVKVLTPSEIRKAAKDGFITNEEAMTRLLDEGYVPKDAEIYLQL